MERIVPVPPDPAASDANSLACEWVFWYVIPNRSGTLRRDPAESWSQFLHPLHSFQTVEDFGRIMNSVEHPAKLLRGCRYYVFRAGVRPLWEEPAARGGHLVIADVPKEPDRSQELELKWIDLVLVTIEEDFPGVDRILGIEYHAREDGWRITVWVGPDSPNLDIIQNALTERITDARIQTQQIAID
jgi:translation initiation factor 4E